MEYVDRFYDNFDSIWGFSFNCPIKNPPPKMKQPPIKVNGKQKLIELGKDPEFTEIVNKKKITLGYNKKMRMDVPIKEHVRKLQVVLDQMDMDLDK